MPLGSPRGRPRGAGTTRRRPSLWSREGAWGTILTSESRPAAGRDVLHGAPQGGAAQGGAALRAVKRFAGGKTLMPGKFTLPEQIKCPWGPRAAGRAGRGRPGVAPVCGDEKRPGLLLQRLSHAQRGGGKPPPYGILMTRPTRSDERGASGRPRPTYSLFTALREEVPPCSAACI